MSQIKKIPFDDGKEKYKTSVELPAPIYVAFNKLEDANIRFKKVDIIIEALDQYFQSKFRELNIEFPTEEEIEQFRHDR